MLVKKIEIDLIRFFILLLLSIIKLFTYILSSRYRRKSVAREGRVEGGCYTHRGGREGEGGREEEGISRREEGRNRDAIHREGEGIGIGIGIGIG